MKYVSDNSQHDQWLRVKEKEYKSLNEHIVSVCHKYGLDQKFSVNYSIDHKVGSDMD